MKKKMLLGLAIWFAFGLGAIVGSVLFPVTEVVAGPTAEPSPEPSHPGTCEQHIALADKTLRWFQQATLDGTVDDEMQDLARRDFSIPKSCF